MQEHKRSYPFSTRIVVGISSVLVVAGGFATWWTWNHTSRDQFPAWVPEVLKPSEPQVSVPKELEAQVYWLKATETDIELVSEPISIKVPSGNEDAQVFKAPKQTQVQLLEQAFNELMTGVDNSEYATTIPQGTELQSISIRENGIHIDLSQDFTFGGGSTSMKGRLAQVLYTATSIDPNAKVHLKVEGEPLEYLGGEGIYVPQPLTRDKFQAQQQL